MPQRPSKPCRHRGCNALTRSSTGYCDAHAVEASGWSRSHKTTAASRGYGYAWQQRRAWVLRRDAELCQVCARAGRVMVATEVDHIVPRAQAKRLGWSRERVDAPENLQSICRGCHATKTAQEAKGLFTPLVG